MAKKDERIIIEKEIKTAGIILLILGAIHIIFSSYLSIGWGIVLLIAGIVAFFYRKVGMLLVFGIGLILVGIMNLTAVGEGTAGWGVLALFQIYWGITEIVRYNKLRKLDQNKRNLTGEQKFLMILGIISLIIITFFAVPFFEGLFSSSTDIIGTDVLYKQENGQTNLVPYNECQYPYAPLGIRCCIPDSTLTTHCKDEATDISNKLIYSADNDRLSSGEMISNLEYGFSFTSPPDYLIITDTTQGGIPSPYSFIAFGQNEEEIDINIVVLEDLYKEMGLNYTESSRTEEFEEGLGEGSNKAFNIIGFSEYGKNVSLIKNRYGKEAKVIEYTGTLDYGYAGREDTYIKYAIFLDKPIFMNFRAPVTYKDYVSEFDDVVDSVNF